MSVAKVRAALETALNGLSPSIATAWENVDYTPVPGTVYQRAYLLLSTPDDPLIGSAIYIEQGIFQVNLFYPLDEGSSASDARAELIRATFKPGSSFTNGGVRVDIARTPEVGPALVDEDRRMVPVRIRFSSQIVRS